MKRKPPEGNVRRVQPIDGNLRYTIVNKCGRTVQCESHLERRLALYLERNRSVKDFNSQPKTFYFIDKDGKRHKYTPDFIAWLIKGIIQIHEVTVPERRKANPYLLVRELGAIEICKSHGWEYFTHTPDTLPNDTETANLLAFYTYRPNAYLNPSIAQAVTEQLHAHSKLLVTDLVNTLAEQQQITDSRTKRPIYACIFYLIWHDEIQIDWKNLFFIDAAPSRSAYVWLNR